MPASAGLSNRQSTHPHTSLILSGTRLQGYLNTKIIFMYTTDQNNIQSILKENYNLGLLNCFQEIEKVDQFKETKTVH